jgi:hypothetical protein
VSIDSIDSVELAKTFIEEQNQIKNSLVFYKIDDEIEDNQNYLVITKHIELVPSLRNAWMGGLQKEKFLSFHITEISNSFDTLSSSNSVSVSTETISIESNDSQTTNNNNSGDKKNKKIDVIEITSISLATTCPLMPIGNLNYMEELSQSLNDGGVKDFFEKQKLSKSQKLRNKKLLAKQQKEDVEKALKQKEIEEQETLENEQIKEKEKEKEEEEEEEEEFICATNNNLCDNQFQYNATYDNQYRNEYIEEYKNYSDASTIVD